jgi:hypothetical protein
MLDNGCMMHGITRGLRSSIQEPHHQKKEMLKTVDKVLSQ